MCPDDNSNWSDARFLVSDGILYDLDIVEDIQRIPVPDFSSSSSSFEGYGVTGSLDYVLRKKAGSLHNRNEKLLCSACLWKATEMMFENPSIGWSKKDYDRLIFWHNDLGMFDEAKKAEEYLNRRSASIKEQDDVVKERNAETIRTQKRFRHDLVSMNDYGTGCCPECAPYRGRVYSISGKSKTFPPLPHYFAKHYNFHPGCTCMISSYDDYMGTVYFQGIQVDAKASSRRPWKDDRSPIEVERYHLRQQQHEKAERERESWEQHTLRRGQNRIEFEAIQKAFPNLAPKSLTGYARMKNGRTKNFLKIASLAKEQGIEIVYFDQEDPSAGDSIEK